MDSEEIRFSLKTNFSSTEQTYRETYREVFNFMLESKPQPEYSTEKWIGSLLWLSEQFLLITHVCLTCQNLFVYWLCIHTWMNFDLNINKPNQ